MNTTRDDIRYALRRIRREPAFAAFAVFIMAVGVAAVTSVFSVMSPLMLRALPFPNAGRLVWVANSSGGGMSSVTSRTSNLRDYRTYNRSFEALTGFYAFFDYSSFNLVGDGTPEDSAERMRVRRRKRKFKRRCKRRKKAGRKMSTRINCICRAAFMKIAIRKKVRAKL